MVDDRKLTGSVSEALHTLSRRMGGLMARPAFGDREVVGAEGLEPPTFAL
jgi:hypothetical protein